MVRGRGWHSHERCGQGGAVPRPLGTCGEELRANSCWYASTCRAHDDHLMQDERRATDGVARAARGAKVHHKALRRQAYTHTQQRPGQSFYFYKVDGKKEVRTEPVTLAQVDELLSCVRFRDERFLTER